MRWQHSINQMLLNHWPYIATSGVFNTFKIKHLSAISKCRTAACVETGRVDSSARRKAIECTLFSCRLYDSTRTKRVVFTASSIAVWATFQNCLANHSSFCQGQNLSLHPHLHCIVPGGGLTPAGKWKTTRTDGKYLFPKNALRKVFRAKFMSALKDLAATNTIELPYKLKEKLYRKKWVVYAKRPFAKPENVIEYLGRYTHKTAISNYRLKQVDE